MQVQDRPGFLQRLNEEQFLAATADVDRPLLVFAGPGSGKTLTITCRIAYLLNQGIDPRRILALTFSRKAADEMRTRCLQYIKNLPLFDPAFLTISNFHSFALKVLRFHHTEAGLVEEFNVLSTYHQRLEVEKCLMEYMRTKPLETLMGEGGEEDEEEILAMMELEGETSAPTIPGKVNLDKKLIFRVQSLIQRVKIRGNTAILTRNQKQLYDTYQSHLLSTNSIDYGDMLLKVTDLWRRREDVLALYRTQFQYLLCDEFQDTNDTQLEMLEMMARGNERITVCGDDDQAIYSWRGATQRAFAKFGELFPNHQKVILTQNYRSTKRIVQLSQRLIGFNKLRTVKQIETANPEGPKARIIIAKNPTSEAVCLANEIERLKEDLHLNYCEIAVLVRLNKHGLGIEKELTKRRIPLVTSAKMTRSIWQNSDVLNLISYMRLALDPNHDASFSRIYNTPKRGIGKAKFAKLQEIVSEQPSLSFYSAAKRLHLSDEAAAKAFAPFLVLIDKMGAYAADHDSVTVFKYILAEVPYDVKSDPETLSAFEHKLMVFSAVQSRSKLSDFLLAFDLGEFDGSNKDYVTLSSIHQAKGLEWELVVLPRMVEGACPSYAFRDVEDPTARKDHMEEERRLAYVAATRSRHHLLVSWSLEDDQGNQSTPSRFLEEMDCEQWEIVPNSVTEEAENRPPIWLGKAKSRDQGEGHEVKKIKKPLGNNRDLQGS